MDPYRELLETRRTNLVKLLRQVGNGGAASAYGCSTSYITQLAKGTRNINERTARRLESVCGLRPRALDRVR